MNIFRNRQYTLLAPSLILLISLVVIGKVWRKSRWLHLNYLPILTNDNQRILMPPEVVKIIHWPTSSRTTGECTLLQRVHVRHSHFPHPNYRLKWRLRNRYNDAMATIRARSVR